MNELQELRLEGVDYYIVDSIQNLRTEDSFIHRSNKLSAFTGSGEARKYVGSYTGENGERLAKFFDYNKWGDTKNAGARTYPLIQKNTCLFSKTNLLKYLDDAQIEYGTQEQVYHQDIGELFAERRKSIADLPNNLISFSIYDVSDFQDSDGRRAYIRSDDEIWNIWRKLVLPKISYLSILKIIPKDGMDKGAPALFYFRIFLDYQFRSIVHPKLILAEGEEPTSEEEEVEEKFKRQYRQGADKYRKEVLNHMPQCPFTLISDESLLIASHIKPYRICIKEQDEAQALDYLNGLSLTPTYDKLFDQGFITFNDDGTLICGTRLSRYTWEKLSLNPNAKNKLRIYPEGREKYLEYHRKSVYQDDIE